MRVTRLAQTISCYQISIYLPAIYYQTTLCNAGLHEENKLTSVCIVYDSPSIQAVDLVTTHPTLESYLLSKKLKTNRSFMCQYVCSCVCVCIRDYNFK